MRQNWKGFGLLAAITVFAVFIRLAWGNDNTEVLRSSASNEVSLQFQAILDTLALSRPVDGRHTGPNRWSDWLQDKEAAADSLRTNAAVFIPFLSSDIALVANLEATNRDRARELTERLAPAMRELGAYASPLLPQLAKNIENQRAVGISMVGIQAIGGSDAGIVLVTALTNHEPTVYNGAMSFISGFATNSHVAERAYPLLLLKLKATNAFTRALSAKVLGELKSGRDTVVPELETVVRNDLDPVVRWAAIQALGRFGTNALTALPLLQAIAKEQSGASEAERKEAKEVIALITGGGASESGTGSIPVNGR